MTVVIPVGHRRTALVTGANKGIGFAIARGLGRLGYEIWLGSRDKDRGAAAVASLRDEGLAVHPLVIDVAEPASVADAAVALGRQSGHLDVLVNNAGVILEPGQPPSGQSLEALRKTYDVNVFGSVLVTQAFLPLLKAAEGARVVMMSSGLGSIGLVTDPSSIYSTANLLAYNSSKTALNAVTVAFAKELESFGIKVNAVEPGNVATDLNGHSGTLSPEEGAASAIRLATIDSTGPTAGFFGIDGDMQPW
jgi:NAD(P)-dependent dehydrogenase (short-subunit alcohol dehydrogenase family)